MDKIQVIIVGGGAAGLMAAITAASNGAGVTVLEQNDNPGRKICVTGNGRCNLTNKDMRPEYFRGDNADFVKKILEQFSTDDTLRFFENLGMKFTDRNGWIYPRSNQAKSVVELMLLRARYLKVKIKTREKVEKIYCENNKWFVKTSGWCYEADKVILANGSSASQVPGSDGSGYALARELGHRIIKPLPALTGLKCKGNYFSAWAGVRTDASIKLIIDDNFVSEEKGELQLTDYGISGIPVFQLSRFALRALDAGNRVEVLINFFPEYTLEELNRLLDIRRQNCPYQSEKELLIGLIPEKLINVLKKDKTFIERLTSFRLEIKGSTGIEQAQVASGGVDTTQLNNETLESLLHKGLYFAGEIIDIDGPCGGYNLQWAWSSGEVAGLACTKENI